METSLMQSVWSRSKDCSRRLRAALAAAPVLFARAFGPCSMDTMEKAYGIFEFGCIVWCILMFGRRCCLAATQFSCWLLLSTLTGACLCYVRRKFTLRTPMVEFTGYDAVVIGCPLEACAIDLSSVLPTGAKLTKRQYQRVVVTFVEGLLRSGTCSCLNVYACMCEHACTMGYLSFGPAPRCTCMHSKAWLVRACRSG